MEIIVLGSAAGGGYPQWNCNCTMCAGHRSGAINSTARTQSSIAVSTPGDGSTPSSDWLLFNTSPDILTQLKATPQLQPARQTRDTGIASIFLLDAQIDHTTGLLMLREHAQPLQIWCTEPVRDDLLHGNPLFKVLGHYCDIEWHTVTPGETLSGVPGAANLDIEVLPLTSNAPPYSPRRDNPVEGDTVGVLMTDRRTDAKVFYAPGLGEIDSAVSAAMAAADTLLVDGTMWTDDEMQQAGISSKTARSMGHLPQSGAGGMLEWLDKLPESTRKILIHINNTNPILNEDGAERLMLAQHGIEVAHDGMVIKC